jgi:protoporphyrinogen oxidase
MAPPGKTSLVAEIPCYENDVLWRAENATSIALVRSHLVRIGWIEEKDILDATVWRMPCAYPVLDLGSEEHVGRIKDYLAAFGNLCLAGRNAEFTHASIHELIAGARQLVTAPVR